MQSATQQNTFADDVSRGLSSEPKFLSSKYFYDDEGSRLFQEIMKLPEYYLTKSEFEIFSTQTKEICAAFGAKTVEFDLIELGAGDGAKTSVLVDYFLKQNAAFTYVPIDISEEALHFLTEKFRVQFPNLLVQTECGDYFRTLKTFKSKSERRKIILFLGSNIGNFGRQQAQDFFVSLRAVMNDDDLLFIGFDLQKDPRTILRAYDDSQNVTASFNINLLARINRELGANFKLEDFSHYASYHPIEGAARSFLMSRKAQTVSVVALNKTFEFAAWEPIFMEISQKYNLGMIEDLAQTSGFKVEKTLPTAETFTLILYGNQVNKKPRNVDLRTGMNFTILRFDSIGSTNTEALNQAKLGAGEGLCVVAKQQMAGRGRHGRSWISEKNAGLYFSLVLRPKIENRFLPLVTLTAAVAVCDALAELYRLKPDIKWANDVHINNKKIGGILAEMTETNGGLAIVVGIGINLKSSNFPPELVEIATSVEAETNLIADTETLLQTLTLQFAKYYRVLNGASGAEKIRREWAKRSSYYEGKSVKVDLGNETIAGTTRGLEENGALRVETASGEIRIVQAGDVERLRKI